VLGPPYAEWMGGPSDSADAAVGTDAGAETDAGAAIAAACRREQAQLVSALTRMTGDVGLAEDLVQDALVAALRQWPHQGVPANPGAWLMTAAKRRAVDHFRHREVERRRVGELTRAHDEVATAPDLDAVVDHVEEDVLRLMFLCCHPTLAPASRAALTLRLVAGLSTAEIARAFLVAEPAMGQRISRAKRALRDAHVPFELPSADERLQRLDDVMATIYLVFNEGHSATAGPDWTRPDLCHEATRLARVLVGLVPEEPEAHALQALLELQASRLPARLDRQGEPVLLAEQDRTRWDRLLVRRGLEALARTEALAATGRPVGRYYLQAAIAAVHARAARAEDTDWARAAHLYDVLAQAAPGPVVEVNRAVAHGAAFGPEAGLAIVDAIGPDALAGSPTVHAVRGDLLARLGRIDEAVDAFRAGASASGNDVERRLLTRRADVLGSAPAPSPTGSAPSARRH
jgi:RNA polymerase sigma factor (sigma-70 family)